MKFIHLVRNGQVILAAYENKSWALRHAELAFCTVETVPVRQELAVADLLPARDAKTVTV